MFGIMIYINKKRSQLPQTKLTVYGFDKYLGPFGFYTKNEE